MSYTRSASLIVWGKRSKLSAFTDSACLDNKSNFTQPQIKQNQQESIWREQIIEAKDQKEKKKKKCQPKHKQYTGKRIERWAGKMAWWVKEPRAKPEFNP